MLVAILVIAGVVLGSKFLIFLGLGLLAIPFIIIGIIFIFLFLALIAKVLNRDKDW